MFATDRIVGFCLDKMQFSAISGYSERNNHINIHSNEDILVFGSSRAIDHYNPKVFEDNLNMTMYNCGQDATGIILYYTQLKFIKERYTPKVIIYDIYLPDISTSYDYVTFLKVLKPYLGKDKIVDEAFALYDTTSKYKKLSKMYCYNSSFMDLLFDNIRKTDWFYKGFYQIMTGEIKDDKAINNNTERIVYDQKKINLFKNFIRENSHDIKFIFTISPKYKATSDKIFEPIISLCRKQNIPVLNHYCDKRFCDNPRLFANPTHMNHKGADLYSEIITHEIDSIYGLTRRSEAATKPIR